MTSLFLLCRVCEFSYRGQRALSRQLLKITTHEAHSSCLKIVAFALLRFHAVMERYESDYSEDFEEEELSSAAAASSKPSAGSLSFGQRKKRREPPQERGKYRYYEEKFTTPSRQPPTSKSRSTGAVSMRRGPAQQSSRRSFLPRRLEPAKIANTSPARDRQLSAMNHKVRGLQNRLTERERQLEEVSKENKLLTRLQKKQDKEWTRIQRQEDELPHILSRHEKEVK